jgi:hypothetical protein
MNTWYNTPVCACVLIDLTGRRGVGNHRTAYSMAGNGTAAVSRAPRATFSRMAAACALVAPLHPQASAAAVRRRRNATTWRQAGASGGQSLESRLPWMLSGVAGLLANDLASHMSNQTKSVGWRASRMRSSLAREHSILGQIFRIWACVNCY